MGPVRERSVRESSLFDQQALWGKTGERGVKPKIVSVLLKPNLIICEMIYFNFVILIPVSLHSYNNHDDHQRWSSCLLCRWSVEISEKSKYIFNSVSSPHLGGKLTIP